MFDLAREIVGTQPILAVFLAIGVGYLVGQLNIGGFSLGVGAVLFVGLAIGAFAPKAQISGPIGLIGPILCIYFMTRRVQPKFPPKAQRFHMGEVTLGIDCAGRTLEDVSKELPSGVQVTMVRKDHQ